MLANAVQLLGGGVEGLPKGQYPPVVLSGKRRREKVLATPKKVPEAQVRPLPKQVVVP